MNSFAPQLTYYPALWRRWAIFSVAGVCAGLLAALPLLWIVRSLFFGLDELPAPLSFLNVVIALLIGVAFGLPMGTGLGVGQAWALRPAVGSQMRWALATIAGWMLGTALALLLVFPLDSEGLPTRLIRMLLGSGLPIGWYALHSVFLGLALGTVIATAQSGHVRHWIGESWPWARLTVGGWMLLAGLGGLVLDLSGPLSPIAGPLVALATAAVVISAASMLSGWLLLRQPG